TVAETGPATLAAAAPAFTGLADPGVASWARCFTQEASRHTFPACPAAVRPWRIRVAESYPFRREVGLAFDDDPAADQLLTVIGDPAGPGASQAALRAAQDAAATGRLVVITTGPGLTGLFASLHAEQPSLGITLLRVPATADGPRLARQHAQAEPGEFRELLVADDGTARQPVLTARAVSGGARFPLGPTDVALVSRSSGPAALAFAQVLACCGAAVAVIGQPRLEEGSGVIAGLEELRRAGARVAYEVVDAADPADMALAVRRIERRLGPVTAIGHAVGATAAVPVAEIRPRTLDVRLAAERAALRDLMNAVSAPRLRLILTFGSVAARYGLPRQGLLAVASAMLADQAEAAARRIPGCRALHIDVPGWAGAALRGRSDLDQSMSEAGMAGMHPDEAARLLLKVLATPGLPERVAVHGRIGVPGPLRAGYAPPAPALTGRFLSEVLVHYPGIELVCDARLSLAADPYLADYRVAGLPVLPPVMALEALAQAASALAGRPLRRATAVTVNAAVTMPAACESGGEMLIRVCARAEAGKITTALRCAESGMVVDHVRAEFSIEEPASLPAWPAAADSGLEETTETRTERTETGTGTTGTGTAETGTAGTVDGGELYGPVCFQTGRFQRIAGLPELSARACRALARGGDDRAWFSAGRGPGGPAQEGLLLGSPGLNDAALQVLQACVPDRRVWLAGWDAATFSGTAADGEVEIRAFASARRPAGPHPIPAIPVARGVPAPAPSLDGPAAPPPAELLWDVEAVDSSGQVLAAWRGVRLREAGPLPRAGAWPLSLLPAYLEHAAIRLGLDPDLRITVSPRLPAGRALAAGGARFAACGWAPADPRHPVWPASEAGLAATFSLLCGHLSEPPVVSAARLQAALACLAQVPVPPDTVVLFERAAPDGWVVLT
ncbi:MAG: KR domain-containing protein, partial [Streptosporangiaceae bacterium]